jgi:hypothetical protein
MKAKNLFLSNIKNNLLRLCGVSQKQKKGDKIAYLKKCSLQKTSKKQKRKNEKIRV